jgi:hypothetical protein
MIGFARIWLTERIFFIKNEFVILFFFCQMNDLIYCFDVLLPNVLIVFLAVYVSCVVVDISSNIV